METESKPVICIIGVRCPPENEAKYDKWYTEKHIPDQLKFKGLRKVTRYKVAGSTAEDRWKVIGADNGYPTFVTIYEFKNREDFEAWDYSPVLIPAREDANRFNKETGTELFWRVQCESIKTWEQ